VYCRADIPATAAGASHLRKEFADWLGRNFALSEDHLYAIVLAAYEAMANAAEHAYLGESRPGTMTITAHHVPDRNNLHVIVSDHGRWRPPTPTRFRGRGLALIRALCDRPTIAKERAGTTLSLEWLKIRAHSFSPAQ
jgi:anti-sigma regulatory factor (Ser/Thr protein kinase)